MTAEYAKPIDVVIVGGGMITHDQLLPSIYELQRRGEVGMIRVCALNSSPLQELANSARLAEAFPGQSFESFPSLDAPSEEMYPDLFGEVVQSLPPRQMVVVAVPDHFHGPVIETALAANQHVLTVKPLVPTYHAAVAIEEKARARGLFVGVEYHKRFDRRSLDARRLYRQGRFGEFKCGDARMIEPYYYRHSNFQNWFTKENSDPFTYVGCHYVDLTYFITGLRPVEISVRGVEGRFPNGNVGWMWAAGRVVWENGAILSVIDGLGYPDEGAGSNDQGLMLLCEGDNCGGTLRHDDQYRGICHGYIDRQAGAVFRFVSPDYFRLVPWEGDGLRPVGYGFDSVEASVQAARNLNAESVGLDEGAALTRRQELLHDIDARGIIATPASSSINELVTEAARLSIARDGETAVIEYEPEPRVRLRR